MRALGAACLAAAVLAAATPAALASSVDYGPISHSGFKTVGAASTSLKLPLQLGFIANQSGLQGAVNARERDRERRQGAEDVRDQVEGL